MGMMTTRMIEKEEYFVGYDDDDDDAHATFAV